MKEFITKVKAFSSDSGPKNHRIAVDDDGTVRVWDGVADHYTTCHSLSAGQKARLRKLAKDA